MKLSQELYHAGVLGHQKSAPTEWEMYSPGRPHQEARRLPPAKGERSGLQMRWRSLADHLNR